MAPESARSWGDANKGDVGRTVEDRKGRGGIIDQVGNGGAVAARDADGKAFGVPPGDGRIIAKRRVDHSSNPEDRAAFDLVDATDDLDSYYVQQARSYYDPTKLEALEAGLSKFGVALDADADQLLLQRGMGACFEILEGTPIMRIKRGATFREVFHELAHVETYRRLLKEAGGNQREAIRKYSELGQAQREVEVYEAWMKRPSNWERLSDEQKKVEKNNYKLYKSLLAKGQQ